MANTLTLGAITVLDLTDTTKWRTTEIDDEPFPDIDREMESGCGTSGTRLKKRQLTSQTIPLKIYCKGATADAAFANRDSIVNALATAVAYQLGDTDSDFYVAAPTYLIRAIEDQSPSDVWTVLDYNLRRIRKSWDVTEKVGLGVDLICYPGQVLPGGV